jgi:MHS family proline/betaine transporter-like MFS transporter
MTAKDGGAENDGLFREESSSSSSSSSKRTVQQHPHRTTTGTTSPSLASSSSSFVLTQYQRRHDFWHTLAGVAGNVLEWFDFSIFGFFSEEIGQAFFPNAQDPVAQSFAVFGGAFLFRPVGGLLLGAIGDKYGREKALRISIFLMAFPTFAMGCLPTYNQVGVVAIVLLIIIRILQGLSVGGQLMSSLVFTLEGHPPQHWGVYGSFVMAAANFGTLLGNLVATFLKATLTQTQIDAWGWRIPFWSGILVSLSGFYLRSSNEGGGGTVGHGKYPNGSKIANDNEYDHEEEDNVDHKYTGPSSTQKVSTGTTGTGTPNPIQLAFSKGNRRSLLAAAMVPCLWSAGFYLSFVWMATYMKDIIEPPVPHSFSINAMSLLLSVCLFFPVAGKISDRWRRRPVMTVGALGIAFVGPVLFWLIRQRDPLVALLSQCLLGVFLSLWGAPMCAWLVESFDPAARLTSVAIGYNIAQATAGGLAPVVATVLADDVSRQAPGYILTVLAMIALLGLWVVAPSPQSALFTPAATTELVMVTGDQNDLERKGDNELTKEVEDDDDDDEEDSYDNELL